jgi:glucose-6-phosphate 1-dehydrogenase
MPKHKSSPLHITVVGASGDLARKKIFPGAVLALLSGVVA